MTPPLDLGLILPGVTRQSLLDLSREWNEVKVTERSFTMGEVRKALKEGRVSIVLSSIKDEIEFLQVKINCGSIYLIWSVLLSLELNFVK